MSLDFTDDQSTLVQVMAWCRQATSHYLSQCWPRSLLPYGVTTWANVDPDLCCHMESLGPMSYLISPGQNGRHFADHIFRCIFINEKFWLGIHWCLFLRSNWALVQVMAWRRTGVKPIPEPMLAQFTDAYMRHKGRWVDMLNDIQLKDFPKTVHDWKGRIPSIEVSNGSFTISYHCQSW